jgi:hypothetical protein
MTTESLMTEAATTTEGNASQAAPAADAAPAAQAVGEAAAATSAATQQQATEGQGTPAAKSGEGDPPQGDQAKPQGAPEKYEFKLPDGIQLDDKGTAAFSEVAKELNLSQEAAQKVLDKMGPVIAGRHAETLTQVKTQWVEAAQTDKEFGGEKLSENLAVAKKALDTFGSPEFRTLLNESGLGNHPEMIRMMFRAGKAISEDKFVPAGSGSPKGAKSLADALYPTQQR